MNFLFPAFLFALSAIAIPVIIHLFNFRKFRKVEFTHVRFLKLIRQERDSRSQLKRWLILAARILAIVFLVLAFAQPIIPPRTPVQAGASAGSKSRSVAVYLDNSYSMTGTGASGTLLEEGKQQARSLADAYDPDDRFMLVTNDFEGKHRRWVSRTAFIGLVDEVQESAARSTFREIYTHLDEVFSDQSSTIKESYLISDFQKNMMSEDGPHADSLVRFTFIPVSGNDLSNVAIDSAWFVSAIHRAGEVEKLVVRLHNYSDKDVAKVPVKLSMNGRQKAVGDVSLPARASARDTLTFRSDQTGWQRGTVSITDNPFIFDDKFYFTYPVSDRLNVLLINGAEARPYLQKLFSGDEHVQLRVRTEQQIDYGIISRHNLVVLNELSTVPSGLSEQIRHFVSAGGHLLVIPGSNIDLPAYNRLLGSLNADRLGNKTRAGKVTGINLQSQVFQEVFEHIPRHPDWPEVNWYYKLAGTTKTRKESLVSLQGNDALIAAYSPAEGKGKVYVSAVPLNEQASSLGRHALFVPLVYRMAMLSVPSYPLYYTIGADQVIRTDALTDFSAADLRLKATGFEVIPDVRNTGAGAELFFADQLKEAGIYELTAGDKQLALFAFNGDREESDLSYLSKDELERLSGDSPARVLDNGGPGYTASLAGAEAGTRLWKYCVILALAFLTCEILLIRFGKQ